MDTADTKSRPLRANLCKLNHASRVLLTLYCSLILPYMSYGICAWGHAAEMHLHKLLVLQKRALRLMFFELIQELMQFHCSKKQSSCKYHSYRLSK